jgi:predicted secreted protein
VFVVVGKDNYDSGKNVIDYVNKIDEESLNNLNKGSNVELPKETNEAPLYTYDVELPNGSVLYNQNDENLEELRRSYTLVISQIQDLNNKL